MRRFFKGYINHLTDIRTAHRTVAAGTSAEAEASAEYVRENIPEIAEAVKPCAASGAEIRINSGMTKLVISGFFIAVR